jgi:hypothetical protein
MDSVKQIKAVAQTYLQEQQLKEQAEYIAVLENTIIAIAKEIGMEPQQLINEINVGGAIKSGFQQGGIMGAVKGGVRAIGHNIRAASTEGGVALPTQGNRLAGAAARAGNRVASGRNIMSDIASAREAHGNKYKPKLGGREEYSASKMRGAGERAIDRIRGIAHNLPGDFTGGRTGRALDSVARGIGRGEAQSSRSGYHVTD